MPASPEHLLRPSLDAEDARPVAIYSDTALFLTTFFGGAIALVCLALVNSRRLGRLGRDLPWGVLAVAATILLYVVLLKTPQGQELVAQHGKSAVRLAAQAFSLLLFGGVYLLHRPFHRSMTIMGVESPSPWKAALTCIAFGYCMSFLLIYWLMG